MLLDNKFLLTLSFLMGLLLDGASPCADGTVSATGWSNSEIFSAFTKDHLIKFLPSRDPGNPVLVLYAGHKSHVPISLIKWAKSEHIIVFVLPPHLLTPTPTLGCKLFWAFRCCLELCLPPVPAWLWGMYCDTARDLSYRLPCVCCNNISSEHHCIIS